MSHYTAKEFPNRTFANKEEMFKALKADKALLIANKMVNTKHADSVGMFSYAVNEKGEKLDKAASDAAGANPEELNLKLVINSCNVFDSHRDVSINGSWNRTAKNTKRVVLLESHEADFDKVITDNVRIAVESIKFKDLGIDAEGSTECLIFYVKIQKSRNPFMFEQYKNGWVYEHSAGLRYVDIELAINSEAEWNKEEKEVWDTYYPMIVNKDDVDLYGYFWAVKEQKIIEGSAVVFGSNFATPVLESDAPVEDDTEEEDKTKKDADPQPSTPPVTKMYNPNLF